MQQVRLNMVRVGSHLPHVKADMRRVGSNMSHVKPDLPRLRPHMAQVRTDIRYVRAYLPQVKGIWGVFGHACCWSGSTTGGTNLKKEMFYFKA